MDVLHQNLEIHHEKLEQLEGWCLLEQPIEGFKEDDVIYTRTVTFEDGVEGDFKVVNTSAGPFTELALFFEEEELAYSLPECSVEGEYFCVFGGKTYCLNVSAGGMDKED